MTKLNYILFFFLLILFSGFQSCEFTEGCQYTRNKNMGISLKNDCNLETLHEWGSIPYDPQEPLFGHTRILRFWFKKEINSSWSIDDICTKVPFAATLRINYDPDAPSGVDDTSYKLLCFYPSVPPSTKILRAEGTQENAHNDPSKAGVSKLGLILPSASKEYTEVSWIEFGIEVRFTALGDRDEDLKSVTSYHQYIYLDVEYTHS